MTGKVEGVGGELSTSLVEPREGVSSSNFFQFLNDPMNVGLMIKQLYQRPLLPLQLWFGLVFSDVGDSISFPWLTMVKSFVFF